jgi:ribose transport system ATP-binding protein
MYIVKGLLILFTVLVDSGSTIYRERSFIRPVFQSRKREIPSDVLKKIALAKDKVLSMKNVTKSFPGMKAIDDISIDFSSGKIHALMGENGAGKSTLMKILKGELKLDGGTIEICGAMVDIDSPRKAGDYGIALIHQEFSLVKELNIYQNIFLGNEIKSKIPFLLDKKRMREMAGNILRSINVEIDVDRKIKDLSVSEQQMVEIAKALKTKAWLLILDEPTSSLTEEGKESLFKVMRDLKSKGMGLIYISHRMHEIYDIADCVTVLRDGKKIGTFNLGDIQPEQIVKMMVGRELENIIDRKKSKFEKVMLRVEKLTKFGKFSDISFDIHAGEVLGLSGLVGAGRTEIAKCIFGLDYYDSGRIFIEGKEVFIRKCPTAIKNGIAYVPEDRRREGFVPFLPIKTNIVMPMYVRINKLGKIIREREREISSTYIKSLRIKTVSDSKNVALLSGGNQQKVSLGKWLATNPKILILDEPTRGIDIGAKFEIHKIISDIASRGIAVLLISSEMQEILSCADNIVVLRGGKIMGKFSSGEATQEKIMAKVAYT